MKNTQISEELFNRICGAIRKGPDTAADTHVMNMIRTSFPEVLEADDPELTETVERVISCAITIPRKNDAVYSDIAGFRDAFKNLWDRVADEPQKLREQYEAALRPYAEAGILKEVFWSDDLSAVRFANGLYGLFDYGMKTSRFYGVLLFERDVSAILLNYLKAPAAYRRCRILDEAGMSVQRVNPLRKGRPGPNSYPPFALTERTFGTDSDSRLYKKKLMQQYDSMEPLTFMRTVVSINMPLEDQAANCTYLAVKLLISDPEMWKLMPLRDYIDVSLGLTDKEKIRTPEDLGRLPSAPETGIVDLEEINRKFHDAETREAEEARAREEKAARIKAYWASHPDEKEALDREENECRERAAALSGQLQEYYREMREAEKDPTESLTEELKRIGEEISEKAYSIHSISFFNKKKRRECQEEIDRLKEKRRSIELELKKTGGSLSEAGEERKRQLTEQYKPLLDEREQIEQRLAAIQYERIADRPAEG